MTNALTAEDLINNLNARIAEKEQLLKIANEELTAERKQKEEFKSKLFKTENDLQRHNDLLRMSQNKLQRALGYIDRVNETAGGHRIVEAAGDVSRIQTTGAMFGPRIEEVY